jgi:hypothetical protein
MHALHHSCSVHNYNLVILPTVATRHCHCSSTHVRSCCSAQQLHLHMLGHAVDIQVAAAQRSHFNGALKLQVHAPLNTAHAALSTAWRRGGVTAASFGGGQRMFDDRWVYPDPVCPDPDRNDEAGKKLAILKGTARAANMTDDMFKAKFMVYNSSSSLPARVIKY